MAEVVGNSLNDPTTSLVGAIDSAVTVLVVAAWSSPLPSTGAFRIRIDDELIAVGGVSGTTFGFLTRGAEGTVAAAHSDGAAVSLVLTAGGLAAYVAGHAGLPDGWTGVGNPASVDAHAGGLSFEGGAGGIVRLDGTDGIYAAAKPGSDPVLQLDRADGTTHILQIVGDGGGGDYEVFVLRRGTTDPSAFVGFTMWSSGKVEVGRGDVAIGADDSATGFGLVMYGQSALSGRLIVVDNGSDTRGINGDWGFGRDGHIYFHTGGVWVQKV